MHIPRLQMFAGETRLFDIDVKDALRSGDTLDSTFVPTAVAQPSTIAVDALSALPDDGVIRFRCSVSAGGFYSVTITFRTMTETARKVRVLIRVDA